MTCCRRTIIAAKTSRLAFQLSFHPHHVTYRQQELTLGLPDTMDASFCGSVAAYLLAHDVRIHLKHHSITSIIIAVTDTLKTEINFNYVTFKDPVRTAQ